MRTKAILLVAILALVVLAGCNLPRRDATGSSTPDVTQAFETVIVRLTQSAALTPSTTPAPSATTASQATPTSTTAASPKASPTATIVTRQCDQAAAGNPIDVTIPDDTPMQPGQAFSKTWRLLNTGTCTWTNDYSIALFSGDPMGAVAGVQLPYEVAPGKSVDISVSLIAPLTAGKYQGDWKLRSSKGTWFGLGANGASSFWVRIVVGAPGSGTPTLTTTPMTATPTTTPATATPVTPYPLVETATEAVLPQVGGSISIMPPSNFNLDNGALGTGAGDDLFYRLGSNGKLALVPLSSARFAKVSSNQPSQSVCKAAPLTSDVLSFTELNEGVVLCYVTDLGRYGRMRLASLDQASLALTIEFLTWATP